jgi:hypothetical protein
MGEREHVIANKAVQQAWNAFERQQSAVDVKELSLALIVEATLMAYERGGLAWGAVIALLEDQAQLMRGNPAGAV